MSDQEKEPNYGPLLRHFSITDGLIRGTGLINFVVIEAAFALLPGFGVYGLLISNTIQQIINGVLEVPLGWIADRFGWAKATIFAFAIKCFVPLIDVAAVYCALLGKTELVWLFVSLDAIVDALFFAIQNGAYEAAYLEWYRVSAEKCFGKHSTDAPPLFIKSLKYSMWVRLLIPVTIIGFVLALHAAPGFADFTAYTATFVALGLISLLRIVGFIRVYRDLRPIIEVEGIRVERQSTIRGMRLIHEVWTPIFENLPAFFMYTAACFQGWLCSAYIAGIGMQQMSKIMLAQPYRWFVSVLLILVVYMLDAIFWATLGHRINKHNASLWVRNLGLSLLGTGLVATTLHLVEATPLIQGLGFAACVMPGLLCSAAIKSFLTSHIREWLKSDFVSTWLSISHAIALISLGLLGWACVYMDKMVPSALVLLVATMLVALGIIYGLNRGVLTPQRETISLQTLLLRTFLGVAMLAGAVMAVGATYVSVAALTLRQHVTEKKHVDRIKEVATRYELASGIPLQEFASLDFPRNTGCVIKESDHLSHHTNCNDARDWLASKDYPVRTQSADGLPVNLIVRFDRTNLVASALKPLALALFLFVFGIFIFYLLMRSITKGIHRELEIVMKHATAKSELEREGCDKCFTITEFKEVTEQLRAGDLVRSELARQQIVSDISLRVAHDIHSPLAVIKAVSRELCSLPEELRTLLQNAVQRICDISSHLLEADRNIRTIAPEADHKSPSPLSCIVGPAVQEVVNEKHSCLRGRPELTLELHLSPSSHGTCIIADSALIKSVLSNVIQNAVEAIDDEGSIKVKVVRKDGWLVISISDSGHGVPKQIKSLLMTTKHSYGKKNGNGLGLYNAKRLIESWGGTIAMESIERKGTKVDIRLVCTEKSHLSNGSPRLVTRAKPQIHIRKNR